MFSAAAQDQEGMYSQGEFPMRSDLSVPKAVHAGFRVPLAVTEMAAVCR